MTNRISILLAACLSAAACGGSPESGGRDSGSSLTNTDVSPSPSPGPQPASAPAAAAAAGKLKKDVLDGLASLSVSPAIDKAKACVGKKKGALLKDEAGNVALCDPQLESKVVMVADVAEGKPFFANVATFDNAGKKAWVTVRLARPASGSGLRFECKASSGTGLVASSATITAATVADYVTARPFCFREAGAPFKIFLKNTSDLDEVVVQHADGTKETLPLVEFK